MFYANTDAEGNYSIRVDTGSYEIELLNPNAYWTICTPNAFVNFDAFYDTLNLDFQAQAVYDCPILQVDIGTPFLRRCFDNTYTVSWCNQGTAIAEDAFVELTFDPWLEVLSANPTWTSFIDNTYTFDIGTVAVGECGDFTVETYLDCDNTVLGQTHCVEAQIFPDSICLPVNTQWDGSSIEVELTCENDSVTFRIQNVGSDMDDSLQYFVIEDHVLLLTQKFKLPQAETFTFNQVANGSTWRLEAEQAAFHPLNIQSVNSSIEACGLNSNNNFTIGFVNQFSDNDHNPFVEEDCRENIGSFDPNDKQAFPKGVTEDNCLFPNKEIEYLIRFQNTGTDTAFRVIIRDTLSPLLDFQTIQGLSSSHPYELEILNNRIVEFKFEDILLPDSTINEAASHGYVRFSIQQLADNPLGSLIANQAAIYFDFNAPIFTNEVIHLIDSCIVFPSSPVNVLSHNITNTLKVFPNPTEDWLTVEFDGLQEATIELTIFNLLGQRVASFTPLQILEGTNQFRLSTKQLDSGTYILCVKGQQKTISQRFIKILNPD